MNRLSNEKQKQSINDINQRLYLIKLTEEEEEVAAGEFEKAKLQV
jgi:hypothetical protein